MYVLSIGPLHRPVIVAVIAVGMMEVPVDQVIDVVAVRNCRVAAVGTVLVPLVVFAASMLGRACGRIGRADGQLVFFNLPAIHMVQVPIMQVINMVVVQDPRVSAVRSVLVLVSFVMSGHGQFPFCEISPARFQFVGVRQRIQNQVGDMPICQSVVDMVA